MICLLVLTLVYGALSAPTAAPDMATLLNQAFKRIDSNGNGKAETSEFLKVFDHYDTDHDGKMTMAEYVAGTTAPKPFAEAIYRNIDSDHDGAVLRTDVNNVTSAFDSNGDGAVSEAEFSTKFQQIFAAVQHTPVGK